ncbi:MAG: electron transport complex subunit RsxD [gamma proteobacterium symbiont of Bathyaustriella thionipta]|nr:electron transport complex subunit RsxD [gamma proteobacterium symbiont of Bathyaustriella thionipta]MCU7949106.1 electron transport complex subunit RsxD [gamma proteobacterium symbiont of Bathyaustriella thionipta]MCU7952802.1 electron transport complex subunit RsxD [gamma proteobacterium symbiont of Bathyaustriella thionipta]MCU7955693.1 electron transport complex subunit RsxD [gamma proteobacterium symbiont of Bathyaustriella thionipta]MCU7968007.1 electron transport complex subunit RsxD 
MFLAQSSPFLKPALSVSKMMRVVTLLMIPGILTATYVFGYGVLINIFLAIIFALSFEAIILYLRKRPIKVYLNDNSALLTAVIIGVALPPLAPWWLTFVGVFFAIVVAKQLYGGLGYNTFNPAMVAYAILLVSFPAQMTTYWQTPIMMLSQVNGQTLSLLETINFQLFAQLPDGVAMDALTSASPLGIVRTSILSGAATISEIDAQGTTFGMLGGIGTEWVNLAFLAGGLFMLRKGLISWHIPLSLLATLGFLSLLFGSFELDSNPSPLFHLFSGATMLGAFFIATDPVTASTTPRGRIFYGAGIGALIYIIRTWGGYPDAVAFSVLIMNMCVPLLDYYTQPRVYGHQVDNDDQELP